MTDFDNLEIRLEDINSSNPGFQRLYDVYVREAEKKDYNIGDFCNHLQERVVDELDGKLSFGQYKEWLKFPEEFTIFFEDCGEEMY